MKTKYIIPILSAFLLLAACKKEEDDQSPGFPQELIYNDVRYEIAGGAFIHYPAFSHAQGQNLDLLLYTEGVSLLLDEDGLPGGASGNGYILYFEGYSSDSTVYPSGTYEMDTTLKAFSFSSGALNPVINGNIDLWFDIKSGSFEVVEENGKHTFIGDGKDEGDLGFNFSYQGNLDWYQES